MKALHTSIIGFALALGAIAGYAQVPATDNSGAADQTQPGHWRKATDPPPAQPTLERAAQVPAAQPADNGADRTMSGPDDGQTAVPPPASEQNQAPPAPANNGWQNGPGQPPAGGGWQNGPAQTPSQGGWSHFGGRPMAPPRQPMPPTITLPTGTWISFRVNEPLSSDRNQVGDAFMGTLAEPVVANGIVLARRGQMVSGRVTEAKKAGRVSGTSRLGVELTGVAIADGQQINLHTQMVERRGDTSYGRDAAAIGTTVATGAAIGAAVNGGVGAGVGAAAGVVASTIGVMLTRGKPTVVYPEQVLTFQLTSPVTVTADFNNLAFQPVTAQDYQASLRTYRPQSYGPGYYAYPYPYPYYGPYYGGYYPWYWGPSIGIGFYGGGWYHGGYWHGGGWGGRGGGWHGGGHR